MSRQHCRGCHRPIRWAYTVKGAIVPLDPQPHPHGSYVYTTTARGWRVHQPGREALAEHAAAERWMPHAATCPTLAAAKAMAEARLW